MTHTIEKYGDIGNFSGVTSVILPFLNLKYVGTLVPAAKIIRDIPDFNVLNVPKTQPRHNAEHLMTNAYYCFTLSGIILWMLPANERLHYLYDVMLSLIGWVPTGIDPWCMQ